MYIGYGINRSPAGGKPADIIRMNMGAKKILRIRLKCLSIEKKSSCTITEFSFLDVMVSKLSWIGKDVSIDLDSSLDISKPVIHHSLSMYLDGVFRNECFDILTTKISTRITMKTKSAYQSDSEGLSFPL